MSNSFVRVPPDSTGKLVDTFQDDNSHERQAIVIADPDTSANVVPIGVDGLLPIKGEQQLDYASNTTATAAVTVFGIALPGTTGPTGVSSGNPLPVTGTLVATISGSVAITNTAFNSTISNASINTTISGSIANTAFNATISNTVLAVTGTVNATVSGSVTITNTAFNSTITGSIANTAFNATISNATLAVVGNVADGSAATGNPVRVGLLAKSPDGTDPGSVDEDDVAAGIADLNRRTFVNPVSPQFGHYNTNATVAISTVGIASPGAGLMLVLTNVIFSSGTTSAPSLTIRENSTTGTIKMGPIYLEAIVGRGFASGPIALPIASSTAVAVLTIGAGNQAIDIDYYIQKV